MPAYTVEREVGVVWAERGEGRPDYVWGMCYLPTAKEFRACARCGGLFLVLGMDDEDGRASLCRRCRRTVEDSPDAF